MNRLVDVYPYYKEHSKVKLLIFKREEDVRYAKQWRMIGGKVLKEETFYEAAIRELTEESGLIPELFWTLPSVNMFYDPQSDKVQNIPAFAAEVDPNDVIVLNHEHSEYQWITEDEIKKYIAWPEQQRLMKLLAYIVTDNKILEEWKIKVPK